MSDNTGRNAVQIRILRRELKVARAASLEAIEILELMAVASTALLARFYGGEDAEEPEVDKLREARDRANDLATRMRKSSHVVG